MSRANQNAILVFLFLWVALAGPWARPDVAPVDTQAVSFDGRYLLMVDTPTTRSTHVSNYMAAEATRQMLTAKTDGWRHWFADTPPATAPAEFRELLPIVEDHVPGVVVTKNRRARVHPVPKDPAGLEKLLD